VSNRDEFAERRLCLTGKGLVADWEVAVSSTHAISVVGNPLAPVIQHPSMLKIRISDNMFLP